MSIHAEVEGVGTLEFPDGTDPSVIQATVKKQIASKAPAKIEPKEPPATWTGAAKGVADAALAVGSGIAQQAVGVPKHLAALAEQVTEPLSRMTPEEKSKETDTNAKPGVTERLQEALRYEPKTAEGKFLLNKIGSTLAPISAVAGEIRQASEATIGKPATDVATDVIGLAGAKGAGTGSKAAQAIRTATTTQSKVERLVSNLSGGASLGEGSVGKAVGGAIAETSAKAKAAGESAYEDLSKAMPPTTLVKIPNATKAAEHYGAGLVVDPKVKAVADKLKSVDSMTFDSLKTLRTQISDLMGSDRNVNRQLRGMRDAVTKDIEARAEQLSPEAKKAWDTANAKWKAYVQADDEIKRVLGKNWQGKTSTELYQKVLLAARADPDKIKTILGAIKNPATRKQLAASVIHTMADKEGEFNGDKLVREWGNMDPDARKALFSSVGGSYEADMSRLVEKLQRIREGHTGLVKEVSGVGVAAILAHLIPGGTKVVGGITLIREGYKFAPATVEKLLSSPQAVKELAALSVAGARKAAATTTLGIQDLPQPSQPARLSDVQ